MMKKTMSRVVLNAVRSVALSGALMSTAGIATAAEPATKAVAKIVAPNMEIGHWTTRVDSTAMIEQMLAMVPAENRAMAKEMMKQQMQDSSITQQCITQDILDNFEDQMKNALNAAPNCEFKVTQSTSQKLVANMSCPGSVINIETNVVNAKRNESTIITEVGGMDKTTITSVSEWQSAVCPEGL